jgi:hypothetical protein
MTTYVDVSTALQLTSSCWSLKFSHPNQFEQKHQELEDYNSLNASTTFKVERRRAVIATLKIIPATTNTASVVNSSQSHERACAGMVKMTPNKLTNKRASKTPIYASEALRFGFSIHKESQFKNWDHIKIYPYL